MKAKPIKACEQLTTSITVAGRGSDVGMFSVDFDAFYRLPTAMDLDIISVINYVFLAYRMTCIVSELHSLILDR